MLFKMIYNIKQICECRRTWSSLVFFPDRYSGRSVDSRWRLSSLRVVFRWWRCTTGLCNAPHWMAWCWISVALPFEGDFFCLCSFRSIAPFSFDFKIIWNLGNLHNGESLVWNLKFLGHTRYLNSTFSSFVERPHFEILHHWAPPPASRTKIPNIL